MLDWLTPLILFFLHGSAPKAVANQTIQAGGTKTVHAMDSGSPTDPSGSSPIIDGSSYP